MKPDPQTVADIIRAALPTGAFQVIINDQGQAWTSIDYDAVAKAVIEWFANLPPNETATRVQKLEAKIAELEAEANDYDYNLRVLIGAEERVGKGTFSAQYLISEVEETLKKRGWTDNHGDGSLWIHDVMVDRLVAAAARPPAWSGTGEEFDDHIREVSAKARADDQDGDV